MKKIAIAAGLLIASSAHADTLYGLYADANYWHTSADNSGNDSDFSYDDHGNYMVSASLEHGIPLIPNVRVRHADITHSKDVTPYSGHKIELTSTDAIAYYELLDNVVSVDVGLGAKQVSGNLRYVSGQEVDLDKTLPMAYASVGAKLPFTGLSAKAELGVGVGKNVKATDAQAEIKYDFVKTAAVDLGIKGGYRILSLDYDEMKLQHLGYVFGRQVPYKADFKGPYIGLEMHF